MPSGVSFLLWDTKKRVQNISEMLIVLKVEQLGKHVWLRGLSVWVEVCLSAGCGVHVLVAWYPVCIHFKVKTCVL